MTKLRNWWEAFWFAPASALNLAAARVVITAHALWILGSRDLAAISGVPPVFWAGVPAGDQWRFLLFPGHPALEGVLQIAAFVALAAAMVGIWPRVACFVAGALIYHLAPLETIFWTPNPFERGLTVTTLALFALAFGRSGDALCAFPRRTSPAPPSGDYRWPLRLVQLQLCQVYFIAGYAKIYRSGLGWASAANLSDWLTVFSQQDQIPVVSRLGFWLADRPWLSGAIGVSALTLDLTLILIVFWPRLRLWLISTMLAFHAGILLTMGILFLNIPQFLIFVDWDRIGRPKRRAAAPVTSLRAGSA